jgi:hypothetical protein
VARIVIIVSAVIIALVGLAFAVMNLGSGGSTPAVPTGGSTIAQDNSSSSADVEEAEEEDDTDARMDDVDDDADADDSADASEDEIYRTLVDAYEKMGSQADGIKDVAATLNNTIFTSDRAKREAAANDAYKLQEQVAGLLGDLRALDVPSSSRYYDDRKTLVALQEDLQKRIDVMCEAWDISLQYSTPKDHESAIKKPLGKDNDSSGTNIYKKDFESRYPSARPQK